MWSSRTEKCHFGLLAVYFWRYVLCLGIVFKMFIVDCRPTGFGKRSLEAVVFALNSKSRHKTERRQAVTKLVCPSGKYHSCNFSMNDYFLVSTNCARSPTLPPILHHPTFSSATFGLNNTWSSESAMDSNFTQINVCFSRSCQSNFSSLFIVFSCLEHFLHQPKVFNSSTT